MSDFVWTLIAARTLRILYSTTGFIKKWCACVGRDKSGFSKDEIELAVFKAFREVLLEVLSFGFGVAELVLVHLLAVLFVDGFSLIHTVIYDAHKQAHN